MNKAERTTRNKKILARLEKTHKQKLMKRALALWRENRTEYQELLCRYEDAKKERANAKICINALKTEVINDLPVALLLALLNEDTLVENISRMNSRRLTEEVEQIIAYKESHSRKEIIDYINESYFLARKKRERKHKFGTSTASKIMTIARPSYIDDLY